jgi:hypothetical protein
MKHFMACPSFASDKLRDVFLRDDGVKRHADDTIKRIQGAKFLDGFFEKSLHHGTRSIDKR